MAPLWWLCVPTVTPILEVSAAARFHQDALRDGLIRLGAPDAPFLKTEDVTHWARAQHIDAFVTRYPQGPARTAVTQIGIPVSQQIRLFDRLAWPHATAGFFKFKAHIPKILRALSSRSCYEDIGRRSVLMLRP